jgi:hypothetical protein
MTRHFSQIGFTEARTFTAQALSQGDYISLDSKEMRQNPTSRWPVFMQSMGLPIGL